MSKPIIEQNGIRLHRCTKNLKTIKHTGVIIRYLRVHLFQFFYAIGDPVYSCFKLPQICCTFGSILIMSYHLNKNG